MSSSHSIPEHQKLKTDLTAAREQLSPALDRYAELCLSIRNTYHQPLFSDTQIAGFPSSELDSELPLLLSLETKLHGVTHNLTRAQELGRAKNNPTYPPLIDRLPDEILVQVFRFVVASEPRDLLPTGKYGAGSFPRNPDYIAQTCARWRKVSLARFPLWTHIYLAPHPTHFNSLLNHAKSYAQRAGHIPLELHITDIEGQTDPNLGMNIVDLWQFLTPISHRIKSLEIVRSGTSNCGIASESFAAIVRGCSKLFTRLVAHSKTLPTPGFIEPLGPNLGEEDWGLAALQVDLSREQIEHGLAHLTVLHATQIIPQWTSTAYHGLVDLRLTSNHKYMSECPSIESSEFTAILTASPGLRILYFGINLEYAGNDEPENYASVRLNDLEVLSLSASYCYGPEDTEYEIKRILQHIIPGPKPLRLILDLAVYYDPRAIDEMKLFFSRAHIVKFCAKRAPPPVALVNCAPHLTQLVFDKCLFDSILYDFKPPQSSAVRLDSWVIHDSSLYTEDLQLLSEQYSARSVIMTKCRLFDKSVGPVEMFGDDLESWEANGRPKHVQYIKCASPPDPTADWDNLD